MKKSLRCIRWFLAGNLVGALVFFCFASTRFAVRNLQFVNAGFLPAYLLLDCEKQYQNANFFTFPRRVVTRKFETHPDVKSIRVSSRLPDSITFQLTPRQPFVVLVDGQGGYVVDADGLLYRRVDPLVVALTEMPLLRWKTEGWRPFRVGDKLPRESVSILHDFLDDVTRTGIGSVREVELDDLGNLSFSTVSGVSVKLGQREGRHQRLEFVDSFLRKLRQMNHGATSIDARVLHGMVWKPVVDE